MTEPALLAASYRTCEGDPREDAFARDCALLLRIQVRLARRLRVRCFEPGARACAHRADDAPMRAHRDRAPDPPLLPPRE